MNFDLEALYGKYIVYSRDFQDDFAQQSGRPSSPDGPSPRMTFIDFCDIWQRWGRQGIQAHWQQQLERGYIRSESNRKPLNQSNFLMSSAG